MVFSTPTSEGWRYYLRLAVNSFATMLDLGLFAFGSALVGLGIAVALSSFGLIAAESDLSTGAALVSALVLGVVGTFAMGIASEGPVRRPSTFVSTSEAEVAIGRAIASVLVGVLFVFLAGRLRPLSEGMTAPIEKGVDLLRAAGIAGLGSVPLLGVPISYAIRRTGVLGDSAVEVDLPVLFAVWVIALIFLR
ncbi:MAG TPA: hypothetical protein VIA81_09445 [Acidimicrobiia bacterium]